MDNKDLELLVEKIKGIAHDDFAYAKEEEYDNPEIAKAVNEMINKIMYRNNHYLVRINDAMTRIADSSCVKTMLDEIDRQKEPVKVLKESADYFNESKAETENGGARVYALSRQIRAAFDDCECQCDDIASRLEAVSAKTKAGSAVNEMINSLKEDVLYLRDEMSSTSGRMRDMGKDIAGMYHAINEQTERYDTMFAAMDSVSNSFSNLFTDCLNVGSHLYRISRDIDNARNDMYRKNSWPLLHDKLKVFEVDHLTLTWRLYNHIVEYETLRINQVNNPEGCKFGVWVHSEIERGSDISKSEAFKAVVEAHHKLHEHALSCFLFKDSFKINEAIDEFYRALDANAKFKEALDALHEYLNSIGIIDETEVWKFTEMNNIKIRL